MFYRNYVFAIPHTVIGSLILVLIALLALFSKGSKRHRQLGYLYFALMIYILFTSQIFSLWRRYFDSSAPEDMKAVSDFFFLQSFIAWASLWFGFRVVRSKHRLTPDPSFLNLMPPFALLLISLLGFVLGIRSGFASFIAWPLIGILFSVRHLQYWWATPTENSWIFYHSEAMIGSAMTPLTAIFVTALPILNVYAWSTSSWIWLGPAVISYVIFRLWWSFRASKVYFPTPLINSHKIESCPPVTDEARNQGQH